MQVTETSTAGLKRELKVVIGQGELGQRFQSRIDEVKDTVQLKGFRKGKVPESHIKKLFGRSVMVEVVQQAIDETSRKAISDRNERPAHQPTIGFGDDNKELMEKVTWPTWAQLQQSTMIVLAATLVITALVWVMDFATGNVLKQVYKFFF